MKKLLAAALIAAVSMSATAALAAGKAKKAAAPKKVECSMGDQKIMTATLDECMKKGGLVMNYPGPGKDMPKAKKGKK